MPDTHAAPPIVSVVPFVLMLLGIAVLPLAAPHFWERNRNKAIVSLVVGTPVAIWTALELPHEFAHVVHDYVSFVLMLGSLYVVSGGIYLAGDLRATPSINVGFLAFGALLSNVVGTTGASMLLIRPVLRTNGERRNVVHTVVFFIFLVSNIGGCLTPLGDPPLFLGYLNGVPFLWTLRLFPVWLAVNAALLLVYWVWDRRVYQRESFVAVIDDRLHVEPLRIHGKRNLILLGGIVLAVAFLPSGWREAAMIALSVLSLVVTPHPVRSANHFSWAPIVEVAVLFAGIFATIAPVMEIVRLRGGGLGIDAPWEFFWATGGLSGFLDNAPTYLTFFSLAQGLDLAPEVAGISHEVLIAISLGAVFMGATTYIGNGPNFMVKAIAESRGVRMPSFGGYMLYSAAVLIPIFLVVGWFLGG